MIGLVPAEYWEYSFFDGLRGFATAIMTSENDSAIAIKGIGNCIPTRSARAAIVTALKALDLPFGASIGVPLYSCPVVFKAITTAGYIPKFIDIDPATYCMSADDLAAKSSTISAVIAIHMFGNLCDMPRLGEAAQGKPIIEDCAQSIGSRLNGRMAGSFGAVAAFSFRSGKYLAVGEGGALFSNNADIYSRMVKMTSALPVPGRVDELRHIAETFVRTALRRKPLWGPVGYHVWARYNKTVKYTEQSPLILEQTYQTDLNLAVHRFKFLDKAIEAQRANADYYAHTLEVDPTMLCAEKPGTFLNRYLYPILFPSSEARDFVADYLLHRRISSIKPYQDITEVAATHYGYSGGCPITESLSKRLLAIPVYHSLKKKEIKRIAQCLNEGWAEAVKRGLGPHD